MTDRDMTDGDMTDNSQVYVSHPDEEARKKQFQDMIDKAKAAREEEEERSKAKATCPAGLGHRFVGETL